MPKEELTFNFTKRSIEAISSPGKIMTFHDIKTRGLKLVVRPTGIKTFILYRKLRGKPERFTLGRYPDLTVEQARTKVVALNSLIAQGTHPKDAFRKEKLEMTLQECFFKYLKQHAKIHKKTWREDERQFERYLTGLKTKKISQISREELQKLHAHIGEKHGIYAANRLMATLRCVFNKAIEWGWSHPNPVIGIKKFKEKSRDRFIQGDELPRFFQALAEEPNETARDYILMSLLTGARKTNVLSMSWHDINFGQMTWRIPETKSGESHTVPLVPTAIALLKKRYQTRKSDTYVFASHGKKGYLDDPKKAWQRILKNANINNLRLHDLRSYSESRIIPSHITKKLGIPGNTLILCLSHSE